jgi:hypothetical protein
MSDECCRIYILADFNGDQIERALMPNPRAAIERKCMRYLFNRVADEIPREAKSRMSWNRLVADTAINEVSFRYDVARHYESDFFRGARHDHNALMLAVLCDKYLDNLNEAIAGKMTDKHGNRFEGVFRDDGFDPRTVSRALNIREEARIVANTHRLSNRKISKEGLFLAHIDALEKLRELEGEIPLPTVTEAERTKNRHLNPIFRFACKGTEIGDVLLDYLARVESKLRPPSPKALLPPPANHRKPALRLVTPEYQPQ